MRYNQDSLRSKDSAWILHRLVELVNVYRCYIRTSLVISDIIHKKILKRTGSVPILVLKYQEYRSLSVNISEVSCKMSFIIAPVCVVSRAGPATVSLSRYWWWREMSTRSSKKNLCGTEWKALSLVTMHARHQSISNFWHTHFSNRSNDNLFSVQFRNRHKMWSSSTPIPTLPLDPTTPSRVSTHHSQLSLQFFLLFAPLLYLYQFLYNAFSHQIGISVRHKVFLTWRLYYKVVAEVQEIQYPEITPTYAAKYVIYAWNKTRIIDS